MTPSPTDPCSIGCGGFDHQKQRGARDERALRETCQWLGLAVTEAMLAIGRRQGVPHGQEVDSRTDEVETGIGERGHHRDRPRDHEGNGLQKNEKARDADGGPRRAAHPRSLLAQMDRRVAHG